MPTIENLPEVIPEGGAALSVCTSLLESAGGDDPLLAILVGLLVTGFLVYRKLRGRK
jgi:hypothetical protein